jgi:hypothetical protein
MIAAELVVTAQMTKQHVTPILDRLGPATDAGRRARVAHARDLGLIG